MIPAMQECSWCMQLYNKSFKYSAQPPSPFVHSIVARKAVSYKPEALFKLPQQEKLSLKEVAQNAVSVEVLSDCGFVV